MINFKKSWHDKEIKPGDRVWWWSMSENYRDGDGELVENIFKGTVESIHDDLRDVTERPGPAAVVVLDDDCDIKNEKIAYVVPCNVLLEGDEYDMKDAGVIFSDELFYKKYGFIYRSH